MGNFPPHPVPSVLTMRVRLVRKMHLALPFDHQIIDGQLGSPSSPTWRPSSPTPCSPSPGADLSGAGLAARSAGRSLLTAGVSGMLPGRGGGG
jgi:hypothetical protein